MSRREILTAVELAAVTTALGAALPILAHATNYGAGWAGPAMAGTLVAGVILAPVAAALLLIAAWKWATRGHDRDDVPPSARALLWPAPDPAEIRAWDRDHPQPDQFAYETARRTRYAPTSTGSAGRHSAPAPVDPPTLVFTAEELAAAGGKPVGGGR